MHSKWAHCTAVPPTVSDSVDSRPARCAWLAERAGRTLRLSAQALCSFVSREQGERGGSLGKRFRHMTVPCVVRSALLLPPRLWALTTGCGCGLPPPPWTEGSSLPATPRCRPLTHPWVSGIFYGIFFSACGATELLLPALFLPAWRHACWVPVVPLGVQGLHAFPFVSDSLSWPQS